MTEAIYLEVSEKTEATKKAGRRVSVSGMLKFLGASRSGYRAWLHRFKIHDYKQAYRLIFEYLEAFYNTKRIHSHCNYMSPNEFERLYERTHTEAELLAG